MAKNPKLGRVANKGRETSNLTVVPPTKKQVQDILFNLRAGTFLEHACLLAGVPARILDRWIELGRANVPGYVEFTDAVDRSNAELGDKLSKIVNQAVADGDMSSLRWLYDKRLGASEKRAQERWLSKQEKAYEQASESDDVVSLEDAEKLLEESLLASEDGGLN